jgi:two-component system cell cycle response regulator
MAATPMPRVLVVDDVLQVRQLFGRFLTLGGMEPAFAADGIEGLRAVRALRPDVVVCDLEMPRMSGIALCAALRADAVTHRIPVVAVTGSGGPAAEATIAAGCDAVLPKPVSRALLLATVRDLIGRTEKARAAAATAPLPPPGESR